MAGLNAPVLAAPPVSIAARYSRNTPKLTRAEPDMSINDGRRYFREDAGVDFFSQF